MNIDKKDELVINFLHYFITEHNYEPLIVHGTHDELWLQNVAADFQIVRIVKKYIHNQEQYQFDQYKTLKVMRTMQTRTFSFNIKTLTIYLNLNDGVTLSQTKKQQSIIVKQKKDMISNEGLIGYFPTLANGIKYTQEDVLSYIELTQDINAATTAKSQLLDDTFKTKVPYVTYWLIAINLLVYLLLLSSFDDIDRINQIYGWFVNVPAKDLSSDYYRLLTSAFLHANLIHIGFNMYALYFIGPIVESYYGKVKYLIIYLASAIGASLLSIVFLKSGASLGASGAIFGLLGAYLYFAYQYRIYMSGVIRTQLLPVIAINLAISLIPGIDLAGHIGGLISGLMMATAVGVYKDSKAKKINGWILYLIYIGFLYFLIIK